MISSDQLGQSDIPARSVRPWIGITIAALIIVGAALWVFSRNQAMQVAQETTITPSEAAMNDSDLVPASEVLPENLDTLPEFLAAPVPSELPKRFQFETLKFASGSAQLLSGSETELAQVAQALRAHPGAKARIEGFVDSSEQASSSLSQDRARSVRDQLVSMGVTSDQLDAIGIGDQNPVASNENAEGRALNRRIELVVTEATP